MIFGLRPDKTGVCVAASAGMEKNSLRLKDDPFTAYKKKLHWIQLMQQHEREKWQPFYRELYKLYAAKEQKRYVFPLVRFMLKHQQAIFRLSKKGFASRLVEILKQARGERP